MDQAEKNILDSLFKNPAQKSAAAAADEIILIIDRSGSMMSIKQDAEGGIHSFIEEQAKIGPANVTLIEFDDRIDRVFEQTDINKVKKYTLEPRGMTALYDAIGVTLANAEYLNTTGKIIVAIVTDGGENSSREYTQEQVFARISELKEKGWNFLFLAANQDAMETGSSIGIDPGSTVTYAATSLGTQGAYMAASVYSTSLRSGKSLQDTEAALDAFIQTNSDLS